MRTLKYAILGLINRQPLTGYDISKEFNGGLSNFWYAKHSQIYPELKRLTEEELISFEVVIQGEKLEKKLYTITEKGKNCLHKWLAKDEPLQPTPKDVFRLKAYFCDEMDKDIILNQFKSELEKHNEKLDYLKDSMNKLLNNENISKINCPEFGDFIVLNGAIMREESYISWIKDCIKRINAK